MKEIYTEVWFDKQRECWHWEATNRLDGNTHVRFSGVMSTKRAAEEQIKIARELLDKLEWPR